MVRASKAAATQIIAGEIISDTDQARELWHKSCFGEKKGKGIITFSPLEALYLVSKDKMNVKGARKVYDYDSLYKKFLREDKSFGLRFPVYEDLRDRGYVVKTALKFGGEFRVYPKGKKPGEAHALWIVYPTKEATTLCWRDFAAKNRVAHSTRKRLLIAVVDEEGDVSYFQIEWTKP